MQRILQYVSHLGSRLGFQLLLLSASPIAMLALVPLDDMLTIFKGMVRCLQGPPLHWVHGCSLLCRNREEGRVEHGGIVIYEMRTFPLELARWSAKRSI